MRDPEQIIEEIERATEALLETLSTSSSARRRAAIEALSSAGPMTAAHLARLEHAKTAGDAAIAGLRQHRAALIDSLERLRAHARWLEEAHLGRSSFPAIELEG